jgi:hypothetical protein
MSSAARILPCTVNPWSGVCIPSSCLLVLPAGRCAFVSEPPQKENITPRWACLSLSCSLCLHNAGAVSCRSHPEREPPRVRRPFYSRYRLARRNDRAPTSSWLPVQSGTPVSAFQREVPGPSEGGYSTERFIFGGLSSSERLARLLELAKRSKAEDGRDVRRITSSPSEAASRRKCGVRRRRRGPVDERRPLTMLAVEASDSPVHPHNS